MSARQVEEGLKQVQAEWLAERMAGADVQRAWEIGKINQLEAAAWVAWDKRQENIELLGDAWETFGRALWLGRETGHNGVSYDYGVGGEDIVAHWR